MHCLGWLAVYLWDHDVVWACVCEDLCGAAVSMSCLHKECCCVFEAQEWVWVPCICISCGVNA